MLTVCRKDENKEKESPNGLFFKKGRMIVVHICCKIVLCGQERLKINVNRPGMAD